MLKSSRGKSWALVTLKNGRTQEYRSASKKHVKRSDQKRKTKRNTHGKKPSNFNNKIAKKRTISK